MFNYGYVSLPQGTNYSILHYQNLAFGVKLLRPNLSTAAGCTPNQRPGACDSGSGILEQPGIAGPLPLEGSKKVVLVVPDGHSRNRFIGGEVPQKLALCGTVPPFEGPEI